MHSLSEQELNSCETHTEEKGFVYKTNHKQKVVSRQKVGKY